eukprot:Skav214048  [mRNA]  locus=scaffold2017:342017:347696:- [translate_table: standard]
MVRVFAYGSLLGTLPVATAGATAHWVGPSTGYAKAQCLDGSSLVWPMTRDVTGLYYFSSGSDDGATKFLIFHEGGGWCSSDADCLERSRGILGSTKSDADAGPMLAIFLHQRILPQFVFFMVFSRRPVNPLMYNWNHVYVRYCDGGYYSGEREEPKVVQQRALLGCYITVALFSDMTNKFNFMNATDVVISGCSAGAIRVYAHLDALRAFLPRSARVVGWAQSLADSGYYMDVSMFTPLKRNVITEQNGTSLLNQDPPAGPTFCKRKECVKTFHGQEEKCLVGSVNAGYLTLVRKLLKTPVFAFQSRFDADQQSCEMGPFCRLSAACVKAYAGSPTMSNLSYALKKTLQHPHGYFLDSCVRHCSFDNLAPRNPVGISPLDAFAMWYAGGQSYFGQDFRYPCPECCSNTMNDHVI